ncbi:MAG: NrdH-redoxin [Methanomicrobiales archaeon HGW-Methanomicrobiales-4]|nr:MAG: NrdH-redoxin [Methanomicrobiales archaeon HGW-Methanomicrobiales-4]
MSQIIIYTMENCPNCNKLKATLEGLDIEYEEKDLETKEAIIDLRVLGCFPQEAPVLRFGRICYESSKIFGEDGTVNHHVIHAISGKVV